MVFTIILTLIIGALLLIFVEWAGDVEVHLSGLLGRKALTVYAAVAAIWWVKCNVYFG